MRNRSDGDLVNIRLLRCAALDWATRGVALRGEMLRDIAASNNSFCLWRLRNPSTGRRRLLLLPLLQIVVRFSSPTATCESKQERD